MASSSSLAFLSSLSLAQRDYLLKRIQGFGLDLVFSLLCLLVCPKQTLWFPCLLSLAPFHPILRSINLWLNLRSCIGISVELCLFHLVFSTRQVWRPEFCDWPLLRCGPRCRSSAAARNCWVLESRAKRPLVSVFYDDLLHPDEYFLIERHVSPD